MKNYEQIISTLLAKIAGLEKVVQEQAARIAELEKRLNKNSSNSVGSYKKSIQVNPMLVRLKFNR